MLNEVFENDDPDLIWWWANEDTKKIIEWENIEYDLTNIEDLYYWLTKQYDKVKHKNLKTHQV